MRGTQQEIEKPTGIVQIVTEQEVSTDVPEIHVHVGDIHAGVALPGPPLKLGLLPIPQEFQL